MRHPLRLLWAGLILLTLAGCSFADGLLLDADQVAWDGQSRLALEPGQPVGQTFVARHGGLSGVEFYLLPEGTATQTLTLHLRADPRSAEDLRTASLTLSADAAPGFYRFSFPPLADSHGRYYYAFLNGGVEGVAVAQAGGDAYLDGAAYQSHEPLDAQTRFRLAYAPSLVALDLAGAMVGWLGLLLAAGWLFVVPGWALLAWLLPEQKLPWAARLGLAAGVGLALYPLLLLWTDLVGLHLGPLYAWLPPLLGLAALVWRYRAWRPAQGVEAVRRWARSEALWPDVTLLIILALVFGVRLLVIRGLDAPMWGDSYQHTMIAQLLVDHGGLFDSWEPYTPYHGLGVHYGFPTVAALLSWLTGASVVQTTLWAGQLLNGLAALTLYPLAVSFAGGRRWAGVGAVLTAGLLSPMPAFYVNWGRYAQLAGQTILPVALWLTRLAGHRPCPIGKHAWLLGGVLAGMTLTYYRIPFYYGVLIALWWPGWEITHGRRERRERLSFLVYAALVMVLLLLPHAPQIVGGNLASSLGKGVARVPPAAKIWADYQVWRTVTFYAPGVLLLAAGGALLWSLVRKEWEVLALGLWVALLALFPAGRLIRLPISNFMQSFAVVIFLYIPLSLLIGWAVGRIGDPFGHRSPTVRRACLSLGLLALALWGLRRQVQIVQPQHIMVTRPDTQAQTWIREHTPPDARFLVEGFRIYDGRSAVGADAGWWIPLLAGRENTMPPQYALLTEQPLEQGYSRRVVELTARLEEVSLASPEGIALLCDYGITHVYIGQGQGEIGAGAVQLFAPAELLASPYLETVYRQDRVLISALTPHACAEVGP